MKQQFSVWMLACSATLALAACTQQSSASGPMAAAREAKISDPGPTQSASTAAPQPDTPSYEVSIASAVGDHERGLDDCNSRPQRERVDCTAKIDSTYTEAKTLAEKNRSDSP